MMGSFDYQPSRRGGFDLFIIFLSSSSLLKFYHLTFSPPLRKMETIRIVTNGVLCTLGLWGHTTLTVAVQLLSIFIWPFSKKLYYAFHAHIMRQWSQNLFEIMRLFAPGELIITFDDSITNDMDDDNNNEALEELLTRNMKGQVTGISFPERLIMISNHQVNFKIFLDTG